MNKKLNKELREKVIHQEVILILKRDYNHLSKIDKEILYFNLKTKLKNSLSIYITSSFKIKNFREKYSKYLQSKEWKDFRLTVLARDDYKCLLCGEYANHVHHLNYQYWIKTGHSHSLHCASLCRFCHEKVHGRKFSFR